MKPNKNGDFAAILIFFVSGIVLLNVLEGGLINHILGICCLIVSVYGVVYLEKEGRFIF